MIDNHSREQGITARNDKLTKVSRWGVEESWGVGKLQTPLMHGNKYVNFILNHYLDYRVTIERYCQSKYRILNSSE